MVSPRTRRRVTMRDVARHAGVSLKTVSNVVNNWPYITGETRAKVQRAIDALGYRPNALASSLRTGHTGTIGIVIPDITNPFFGQVVRGCEDVLYTAGYSLFLCNTGEDPNKEIDYLQMLVDRGVDGLLMFGARCSAEVFAAVVHDGIPIVAEDSPAQHCNTTVIEIDNRGGAEMAVRHLLARGHTRIAHIGGPRQRLAADHRLQGYRQALEGAGIPYDEALVYRCPPTIRGGLQATLDLVHKTRVSALFCYNDLMAVGAMIACQQTGLRVPRDMAIVGFDDVALASLVRPALTTVRVRQVDMGRLASQLLLERLSGQESPKAHVQFPVELVVRSSCGARRLTRRALNRMLEQLLNTEMADLATGTRAMHERDL